MNYSHKPSYQKLHCLEVGVGETREERAEVGSSISVGSRRNREELTQYCFMFRNKKKRLKGGNQKGGWNRECKVREEGAFDITQERTGESDESNRPRMTN